MPLRASGDVVETLRDRIELEGNADEALEERVVQFAAETHPFAEDERKVAAKLPDPQLPRAPDRLPTAPVHEAVKPPRSVKTRRDRKRPRRFGFRPASFVAAGVNLKRVAAGRQIRIQRLAAIAGINPAAVESIEPIAETRLQRIRQFRDRVADLEFRRTCRQRLAPRRQPVDRSRRSHRWRRVASGVRGQRARFHDGEAAARHEPQRAVARANAIAIAGLDREAGETVRRVVQYGNAFDSRDWPSRRRIPNARVE